ncbi:hypothetical protein CDL12_07008 [Handroanthus impetiginosus]|uniref:Uncharacterized protein n=1 Tax=Handroanthus impetiginosus TaxID=429701 RepID=A0A2G9HS21_9LAMI|nr:hypothetical protein CDL12_07008 [Handroanthus impetiginosus]
MEVTNFSSDVSTLRKQVVLCSFVEAAVVNTLLAAQKSLACLLMLTGSLLNDVDGLPDWNEKWFPMSELYRLEKPGPENQDASDTEDEDEDDEDADDQDDDDAGDEDFSGGEEGGDDDEGDPEEDPEANGNEGSDDDDEEDDDGDDDEDGDEDDDEEEDEDEEDQPPAKKRK